MDARVLRPARAANALHRPQGPAGPPFGEAELVALVAATLRDLHPGLPGLPAVEPSLSLDRDLGFDSLGRMELLLRLEAAAGVALPEDTLARAETVDDLWQAVRRGRSRPGGSTNGNADGARGDVGGGGAEPARPAAPASARIANAGPRPEGGAAADAAPWTRVQTLLEVVDAHLAVHPDRVQVISLADETRTPLTYRRLAEGADAVAAGLQRAGLQPRQTVAIMLPTSPEYFFTYLGILRAGGIPVPIYPPARPSQLEDHVRRHTGILANAQVRLLVSVPEAMTVARLLQARVPGLHAVLTPAQLAEGAGGGAARPTPVAVQAEDIAFIQYTSGSTGQPKGVALSHANLLANIRAMAQAVQATPDDVFVSWLPLYHDMGLIGAWLGGFTVGFQLVVMSPLAFLARPRRWLEVLTEHRGTLSAGPNFAYELCLARIGSDALAGLDLSHWRLAFNGAEAVSPDTVLRFGERFAACGLRPQAVTPVYGLAEASVGLLFPPLGRGPRIDRVERSVFERERRALPAAANDAGALRFVACGRVLPGHAVRIVDDAGQPLPDRVEGRLEFRGPSATRGYWRAPEHTARLFRSGEGGWLDTGDRAYAVEGEVFVTGRVKDIVIRGGRNLYPQEIEEAVGAVPGVRKGCVAVFGRPDARSGTEGLVVLAETQSSGARDPAALREAIGRAVVDAIGEPADEIVLAPPHTVLKTSSGKVRRSACRDLLEQGQVGSAPAGLGRQWLRLAAGGMALRLRSAGQDAGGVLWSLRAAGLFWLFAPPSWAWAVTRGSADAAWAFCHRAARLLLRLAGAPVAVHGLEHLPAGGPVVVVCNHASYLDGMVLVAALPRRHAFVAKRELQASFVAGRFLERLGAAFVERFDPKCSVADAQRMAEDASAGVPLLVFPEGTFVAAPGLLPFHLGAFLAAAQARVPVVPITLSGTRRMLGGERRWPRRAALALHVGRPIEPPPAGTELFAAAVQMRDAAAATIARGLVDEDA
jgi:1-acyl-sn-glycerol-3-phosphate acyltransferase